MKLPLNVNIHHLSRVEGHGNIDIRISGGRLQHARWDVVETPRFFEAMLVGKLWENAPWVSGRICGICSIGHTLASIRAIENAFGFTPPQGTAMLRLLLKHMETLQSHVLHLYFLSAPDFLGVDSVFPLIEGSPEVVARAVRLKKLANDVCDCVGGRRLHPTRCVVGGFTMLPDPKALAALRRRLADAVPDLEATAEIFRTFAIPGFERQTEFVSLKADPGDPQGYPFIGGGLVSTDGVNKKEHEYRAMTNEFMVDHSTSKWSRLSRESFAVGALARLNNNFGHLMPQARELAESFGLRPVNHNPFMNNVAQLVECLHVTLHSMELIDRYLGDASLGDAPPRLSVEPREGQGVGAVEVPRGILYHSYVFDSGGRIRSCDCVIPTSQNHANIQLDLEALATRYAGGSDPLCDRDLELLASMLVRAYDPCISCSVH